MTSELDHRVIAPPAVVNDFRTEVLVPAPRVTSWVPFRRMREAFEVVRLAETVIDFP